MNAEDASSLLGWISIATWVVVYSPQIIECYRLKSGEGLSVPFLFLWLLGDLTNLIGAGLANLLPTMIILAAWYSVCDIVLLIQVYYYRWVNSDEALFISEDGAPGAGGEGEPLLAGSGNEEAKKQHTDGASLYKEILLYSIGIIVAGVLAWVVSNQASERTSTVEEKVEWRSQILGWSSAVLYLGSRIPQIMKNVETKCQGLSPLLFILSIIGNATYSASIIVAGMDPNHLFVNASWLAGSALTIFLDAFVLTQFSRYRREAAVAA